MEGMIEELNHCVPGARDNSVLVTPVLIVYLFFVCSYMCIYLRKSLIASHTLLLFFILGSKLQ